MLRGARHAYLRMRINVRIPGEPNTQRLSLFHEWCRGAVEVASEDVLSHGASQMVVVGGKLALAASRDMTRLRVASWFAETCRYDNPQLTSVNIVRSNTDIQFRRLQNITTQTFCGYLYIYSDNPRLSAGTTLRGNRERNLTLYAAFSLGTRRL